MKKANNDLLYSKKDKKGIVFLYLLFLLYSLFTFFGGDNARYESFVEDNSLFVEAELGSIDPLYYYLAASSGGNFLLWKIMVYGSALLITYYTLSKQRVNNYVALFAFSVFALSSYGTTRGVLAYAIFLCALTLIGDSKIIIKIIGFALAVLSISAHSSMVLPVALLPLILIRLDKAKVIALLFLFPILLSALNFLLPYLLTNQVFMGMQSGYKFEVYTEQDNVGTGSSLLLSLHYLLDYAAILLGLYFSIIADRKKILPKPISFVVRLSFFLFYIALLINFSVLPNSSFISTRYITMVPFFLFITWPFILNNKEVFNSRTQRLYISVSVLDVLFLFFMISFYSFS